MIKITVEEFVEIHEMLLTKFAEFVESRRAHSVHDLHSVPLEARTRFFEVDSADIVRVAQILDVFVNTHNIEELRDDLVYMDTAIRERFDAVINLVYEVIDHHTPAE